MQAPWPKNNLNRVKFSGDFMELHSFIDYYEDLQVSPNADQETVERVYRLLAKRYHPDNQLTGDIEKFDFITKAYKVLADPEKRAAYDAGYSDKKNLFWKTLSGNPHGGEYENDKQLRKSILSILYVERRQNVSNSSIGLWHLEKLLEWPEKMLEFHIWYLKEKNWIERTDTGGFAITAEGVDEIENDVLILRKDRLLSQSTETSRKIEKSTLIKTSA
jgi:curved DNA-binding protein